MEDLHHAPTYEARQRRLDFLHNHLAPQPWPQPLDREWFTLALDDRLQKFPDLLAAIQAAADAHPWPARRPPDRGNPHP